MTKTLKRCAAFICAMIFSVFILNIETPLGFSLMPKAADSETSDHNVTMKFENEDGTPFNFFNSYGTTLFRLHQTAADKYIYIGPSYDGKFFEGKYNLNLSDGDYALSKYIPSYGGNFDYSYTQEVDFTIKNGEITNLSNAKYCRQEDAHTIVFTLVPVEPEELVFTSGDSLYTQRTFESYEIVDMQTPSASSVSYGEVSCSYDKNTKSIKIVLNRSGIWTGYMLYVFLSDGELYRINISCQIPQTTTTTTSYIVTTNKTSSASKNTTSAAKPTTSRTTQTARPTTTTTATAPALVINRNSLTLENGEQFAITANQSDLTFVSNNKDVAVVSKSGVVTAVGEGSAIISVINSDGDVAQMKLTVVKPNSIGDCNDDGTFSIADIVVLQKWLLNEDEFIADWKAADVDGDGILDVYDLCLMRKKFVQKNS